MFLYKYLKESKNLNCEIRQKKRLELMLRKLTPEKTRITDAMIFCIEHAEASDEIIDFITESLNSVKTPIPKKVSSIYKVTTELFFHYLLFSP